jgi:hypothetical protein
MDTKTLIAEAKARFNHNSAKAQLKDKYEGKLLIAEQGGLWKASMELINFLHLTPGKEIVLIDNYDNVVKVDRAELLSKLRDTYNSVMESWYIDWKEVESKR